MSELLCVDRVRLEKMLSVRQMLRNYRSTQAAQSGKVTMDSLFVQVSRDEYGLLIELSIEALRNRLIDA